VSAERQPLSEIVVVGCDADLWLAALALRRALGRSGPRVTAVELPSTAPKSAVVACLPQVTALHDKLGLAEASLLAATQASYTHGQAFVGRGVDWQPFFHAWAPYEWPAGGLPFFPCWLKARATGLDARLEEFCLPAVAAREGRIVVAPEPDGARGPSHAGLHVESARYAAYLKSAARALGLPIVEASSIAVERRADAISAVLVDVTGARVEGELFVDATGTDALLIGELGGVDSIDGRADSGVDRILTARAPRFRRVPPLSEVRVGPAGWTALHPTPALTAVTHAYSSQVTSDEEAAQHASAAADVAIADVEIRAPRIGVRREPWRQNCVALGAAAGALDPIHDAATLVLQLGIVHLLTLLPDTSACQAERAEYNRVLSSSLARLMDFQAAFYRLAPVGGAFWDAGRARAPSSELDFKIAAFRARGLFAPMEDDVFPAESWQALLTGFGLYPESLPPVVSGAAMAPIATELARQRRRVRDAMKRLPQHEEYLRRQTASGSARAVT
jgi:tryptophan halogenase